MAKQDIYAWPEGEDDNFDYKSREQAKSMTVEEIDKDWEDFLSKLKFETI